MSWNTARKKVTESSANNANPFPIFPRKEKQRNRKREIEPIDQLWLFLKRVRLGLFKSDACLGLLFLKPSLERTLLLVYSLFPIPLVLMCSRSDIFGCDFLVMSSSFQMSHKMTTAPTVESRTVAYHTLLQESLASRFGYKSFVTLHRISSIMVMTRARYFSTVDKRNFR